MKLYQIAFVLLVITLGSCSVPGKEDDTRSKDSTMQKPVIDLRSAGIEDLSQSTDMKEILCQDWENKEDAMFAGNADPNSGLDLPYRGYCFFKDGKMVKDPRGFIKTGTWSLQYDPKPITILMNFDDRAKQSEIPWAFTPTKLNFVGRTGVKPATLLAANAYRHMNLDQDPFYPDNVWWMITPGAPETEDEIKKRFKACLHFFVLFYEEAVITRPKKVSFYGLPSPFKWYAGGIILQKENKLTHKWINCFYDREQATTAYRFADKLFDKKYDWPKDEGQWMKRNLGVLKQMEKRLDSISLTN